MDCTFSSHNRRYDRATRLTRVESCATRRNDLNGVQTMETYELNPYEPRGAAKVTTTGINPV